METLILAGGLGTRLGTLTKSTPKPMLPVGGRPFLEWQLEYLAEQGVDRFILSVGYLGDQIQAHFGPAFRAIPITYVKEAAPLGTAGALLHALPQITDENILVVNGDTFQRLDLADLFETHEAHHADATLTVLHAIASANVGVAEIDSEGKVVHVFRGRRGGRRPSYLLSGSFLFRTETLRKVANSPQAADWRGLESDLLPVLIDFARVYAHVSAAPYLDIGRTDSYRTANARLQELRGPR